MSQPRLVTPPTDHPVSLEEVKRHCRVEDLESSSLDDEFTAFIEAATAHLDGYSGVLGRCLINQVWAIDLSGWAGRVQLPFPNVSAAEVTYRDTNGDEQTVAATAYELIEKPRATVLWFKPGFSAPGLSDNYAEPITIRMTAGYGANATTVPAPIKQAIKMLVAHYDDLGREAVTLEGAPREVPLGFDALIAPYRRRGL